MNSEATTMEGNPFSISPPTNEGIRNLHETIKSGCQRGFCRNGVHLPVAFTRGVHPSQRLHPLGEEVGVNCGLTCPSPCHD